MNGEENLRAEQTDNVTAFPQRVMSYWETPKDISPDIWRVSPRPLVKLRILKLVCVGQCYFKMEKDFLQFTRIFSVE